MNKSNDFFFVNELQSDNTNLPKNQTIYRIRKRDPGYTQVCNDIINETGLSWKAKGILIYLLSKPDGWTVRENNIVKHSVDGLKATKAGIKELINRGYMSRRKIRDYQGKYRGWETIVCEVPFTEIPFSDVGFSDVRLPDVRESHLTNTDKSNTDDKNTNITTASSCCDPHKMQTKGKCFPAVTGREAEIIVDAVIEIQYACGGVRNRDGLRQHLKKMLEGGNLLVPDRWDEYIREKEDSIERANREKTERQQEEEEKTRARQAVEAFEALPASEQEKYIEMARATTEKNLDVSDSVIRIIAAQMAAGEKT
ncbi:MAG TPA: hypothetical protein VFG29_05705 [Syntrophales bacterium]|nr:hypothetical protein [Syntrophales bacterium]